MTPSTLRAAIDGVGSAIGMFVMLDGGASARLLAHAGYDFVVFDLQHGAIDLAGIEAVLGGVKGTRCTPIARVHPRRPDQIEWVLDLGAHGVVVPMVNSAEDARLATNACWYPPRGRRSVAALRNILVRGPDYTEQANGDGQMVPLAQFKGQPTVVNLWATWCPPCVREMPVLRQAQIDYPSVNFVFVCEPARIR